MLTMEPNFVIEHRNLPSFTIPCKYNIKCRNSACTYWHYSQINELCKWGTECRDKNQCGRSHEKPKFCNKSNCSMIKCTYCHPCKYQIKCDNNNCKYDHPIQGNRGAFGKSNLLDLSTKCLMKLDLKFFDVKIYYGQYLNNLNWVKLFELLQLFKLDWITSASVYEFKPHQSFLNFANKKLGGGFLGRGNVQEEILSRQLCLSQYLFKLDQFNSESLLKNNLESDPIVIDTYAGIKEDNRPEMYGHAGVDIAAKRTNLIGLYIPIDPIPIRWICIAASKLYKSDGSAYTDKIVLDTIISLAKGLATAIYADDSDSTVETIILNIGNIGCGAFNHNYNLIWNLLYGAVCCAIKLVNPVKNVQIIYHAYNIDILNGLVSNGMVFNDGCIQKSLSIKNMMDNLRSLQRSAPEIWSRKL